MRVPVLILFWVICLGMPVFATETKNISIAKPTFAELQKKAAKFGTILSLETFENLPEEVIKSADAAIAQANKRLDTIGALNPKKVTFQNTIRALDDLRSDFIQVANRGVERSASGSQGSRNGSRSQSKVQRLGCQC